MFGPFFDIGDIFIQPDGLQRPRHVTGVIGLLAYREVIVDC
jgi:hypothetical protein